MFACDIAVACSQERATSYYWRRQQIPNFPNNDAEQQRIETSNPSRCHDVEVAAVVGMTMRPGTDGLPEAVCRIQ